ncbi:MAG: glycogen debranching enzyme, partial [Lachnospiraceae bacterium]|nr:glycogen debranching enzyme [Lachnospiraceae bacterium]
RRFIKGEGWTAPDLLQRISGSPDLYEGRGPASSVNFITCHDGFTLYDLVSYNEKHNFANGEDNRDGCNDNDSWNCGIEGETDDPQVLKLRNRQIKNAVAILLMSRGVPMLLAGDEFGNTQFGNNNAYCQDNKISWLNWEAFDGHRDIYEFFRKMIAFRMAHPVIRRSDFFDGRNTLGYPELSLHGTRPWEFDENTPFLTFGLMYSEPAECFGTAEDAFIYCAVNAYWEDVTFELPIIPEGMRWEITAYTGDDGLSGTLLADRSVSLMARSVMILTGHVVKVKNDILS